MSKVCEITGKSVMSGNHVSHANNRVRRRFLPNLQETSLISDLLGQKFRFRVTARGIRTVEHNGGLDGFLMSTPARKLSTKALRLKKLIEKQALNTPHN
jgi:large subunit ribosomal protein L28